MTALLVQTVYAASILPKNERCVTAAYTALNYLSFEGESRTGFWQTRCRTSANIELLPRQTVAENLTEEKIKQMKIVDFYAVPRDEVLNSPVLISSAYYDRVFRTIVRNIPIHNGGERRSY